MDLLPAINKKFDPQEAMSGGHSKYHLKTNEKLFKIGYLSFTYT